MCHVSGRAKVSGGGVRMEKFRKILRSESHFQTQVMEGRDGAHRGQVNTRKTREVSKQTTSSEVDHRLHGPLLEAERQPVRYEEEAGR